MVNIKYNKHKRAKYNKKWYVANKLSILSRIHHNYILKKEWFNNIKKSYRCNYCNDRNYKHLDFYEFKNNKILRFRIVNYMVTKTFCKNKILNKIRKSKCVCFNCSRELF